MDAEGPLGVWLIGALGAVSTTTLLGAAALGRGVIAPTGMVTAHDPFASVPMRSLAALVFGGHDVRCGSPHDAARRLSRIMGDLDAALVEAVSDELIECQARLRPAPWPPPPNRPLRAVVLAFQRDVADFSAATGARRTVVVNLASTEPPPAPHRAHQDLGALESALDDISGHHASFPPSLLYAYAAIDAGLPYVNFTPSIGAAVPALEQLARERRVPHAGSDGKTGETLLKTALAPMFAMRRLEVKSWSGFNLLGNADGETLSDPQASRSKTASKGRAVPAILGYQPHTLIHIDYVPSCGDRKVAWDLVQFEGFLATPMSLQLTWQASDSALAAPLVLDLVRLIDLAAGRGESGALGYLAFFFKTPLGSKVHDLFRQYAMLREHLRC